MILDGILIGVPWDPAPNQQPSSSTQEWDSDEVDW